MYYISYGSNMNVDQMKTRIPKATPVGKAFLHNWKLDFKGVDGSAYATISKVKGYITPVVVWEIREKDVKTMDQYEGYPSAYFKQTIAFYLNGKKHFGLVYIMNATRRVARPSRKYVNTVRRGYEAFGISQKYLTDALRRNSNDFYLDDLVEVREITKLPTAKRSNTDYSSITIWKPVATNKEKEKKNKNNSRYVHNGSYWEDLPPKYYSKK